MVLLRTFIFGMLFLISIQSAWAGTITPDQAHRVAQGQVRHHMAIFGDWNGTTAPTVGRHEVVSLGGAHTAFHFPIHPSGYVVVSAYDMLSPVPIYSTTSTLDIRRAGKSNAIETWMLGRLYAKAEAAVKFEKIKTAPSGTSGLTDTESRAGRSWAYFEGLGRQRVEENTYRNLNGPADGGSGQIIRGATVAPLLSTVWGQEAPYNNDTPDDGCHNGHTLTGCVATAWAQVLNYWQWPPQSTGGEGSHSYTWEGATESSALSVTFSNPEAYDWANMADNLLAPDTTQVQKNAVSKLMYYIAVSADMNFGCPESNTGSGSARWADQVLDTYFRYKPLDDVNHRLELEDYTALQWFNIIKKELDADPPRPVIFSMGSQAGWHEVVIDGYSEDVANKVHINFGWDGNYDAFLDISDDDDFNTPGFDWAVEIDQVIVIGIEPDRTSTTPSTGGGGGGGGGGGCFINVLVF